MEVRLARTAGFCFGVERAVNTVYEEIKKEAKPIYTYGPIIHNEKVVEDFESKGVEVLPEEKEVPENLSGTVVIRSHGVSRKVCENLQKPDVNLVDATCPFVKKIHRIVESRGKEGNVILIAGDAKHPEVQGIIGWCTGPVYILQTFEEFCEIPDLCGKKITLVAQTTFNYKKFRDLVAKISEKGYDINVLNTICNATQERQEEARQIAAEVDGMIVIGGKNSSNTQKLFEICKKECNNTYHVQCADDLQLEWFYGLEVIGITAGASTPKNIIEEVQKRMSEVSFEQMLEASLKTISTGEVVTGTVIGVKEDEIILNIGYKADGIISRSEYTNDSSADLTKLVNVGDELEVKVLKVNDGEGQVQLSYRRLQAEKSSKLLEEAFENKYVLKAPVSQVLNGGLSVIIDDTRIFIPASLVSDVYERNLEKYAGQEVEFVLTEFNPKKRRIIGDCKQLIVARKAELQKELFEKIEAGMVVEGTVKNVTDFGAFIDLGGADGLLHISEMSWGRVEHPKKAFKSGDKVEVLIKEIEGAKIALSLKFPEKNPWLTAPEKYAVGNVVSGKVARMTDFGAFVELETGIDALLHVSQISKEHVAKPADVLKIGQEVEAKVVDFNEETKKISLSMKALVQDEAPVEVAAEEVATEE